MAGEAVTAMIVAADAGDNPLADRREDREAAAARGEEGEGGEAQLADGERDGGGAGAAGREGAGSLRRGGHQGELTRSRERQ